MPVSATVIEAWRAAVIRRAAGEPLAYLLGSIEFFGLSLRVTPSVLVPRPDTETLVNWAIELLQQRAAALPSPRVLDLGTGSGAIALAIKHACRAASVVATDTSAQALTVAESNGQELGLGVEWRLGDWWHPVDSDRFDLVVSNPPYIAAHDPHLAALSHEPALALTSGADGLSALRHIVAGSPGQLNTGGWLLVEHGYNQASAMRDLFVATGFTDVGTRFDFGGQPRCTGAKWEPNILATKSARKA